RIGTAQIERSAADIDHGEVEPEIFCPIDHEHGRREQIEVGDLAELGNAASPRRMSCRSYSNQKGVVGHRVADASKICAVASVTQAFRSKCATWKRACAFHFFSAAAGASCSRRAGSFSRSTPVLCCVSSTIFSKT